MALEFVMESQAEQDRRAKEFFEKYGDRPRRYRNGLGLAIPQKTQVETLRRAVRYLLAIERVEQRKIQLSLTKDQLDQLKERRRTEEAAAEAAFRQLYPVVWLPTVEAGAIGIDKSVEVGGRPLQAAGIHERVMELLTTVGGKVFGSTTPRKIVELLKLGEPDRMGVRAAEVRDAFFSFLGFPRLDSSQALKKAIARAVSGDSPEFAYFSGTVPTLGPNGKFQVNIDRVVYKRALAEDEVDLETGFLIVPSALPEIEVPPPPPPLQTRRRHFSKDMKAAPETTAFWYLEEKVDQFGQVASFEWFYADGSLVPREKRPKEEALPPLPPPLPPSHTEVSLLLAGNRDQLFAGWQAIANLAEKAGSVSLQVSAKSSAGFDPNWLRNAVLEPLEGADLLRKG